MGGATSSANHCCGEMGRVVSCRVPVALVYRDASSSFTLEKWGSQNASPLAAASSSSSASSPGLSTPTAPATPQVARAESTSSERYVPAAPEGPEAAAQSAPCALSAYTNDVRLKVPAGTRFLVVACEKLVALCGPSRHRVFVRGAAPLKLSRVSACMRGRHAKRGGGSGGGVGVCYKWERDRRHLYELHHIRDLRFFLDKRREHLMLGRMLIAVNLEHFMYVSLPPAFDGLEEARRGLLYRWKPHYFQSAEAEPRTPSTSGSPVSVSSCPAATPVESAPAPPGAESHEEARVEQKRE